jgi:16S rRNA (guanine527-N7)-methyltransferase
LKPSNFSKIIGNYFPELDSQSLEKFNALFELYQHWNNQINVISRKDLENFYIRHVLHSLAIAKFIKFNKNASVLDVGTGGGFPGIPLAIFFKDVQFTLIDSIGKKIKVVKEVSNALELNNVKSFHMRAENMNDKFDFVVSRAVTHFSRFCPWVSSNIKDKSSHKLKNGIIYLKGGDLKEEINSISKKYNVTNQSIYELFKEEFFETKSIVYLSRK